MDTLSRFNVQKSHNSTGYLEFVSQERNNLGFLDQKTRKISMDRGETFQETEYAYYYSFKLLNGQK